VVQAARLQEEQASRLHHGLTWDARPLTKVHGGTVNL